MTHFFLKKIKPLFFTVLYFLFLSQHLYSQKNDFKGKEISFPSIDSLEITADLYLTDQESSTYIILCHQAYFSRGAYRSIAPKLNELGYHCLAIDQRSGYKVEGIKNKTCKKASKANKPRKYKDAIPDVEAALLYAKKELKAKKIILWGSSYSASIVIYLGSKYPNEIDGIMSFSPGEYFTINDQKISSFANKVTCPVFVTSAKKEQKKWNNIYNQISSKKSYFLPSKGGFHGSKTLWPKKKGNEVYWKSVRDFLATIKN